MQIQRINADNFTMWRTQIAELFNVSVKLNFPHAFVDAGYGEKKCDDVAAYLEDGSAVVFAATQQDKLLGWIWCHKIARMGGSRLHIAEIAVSDDCRKKGVGSRLLAEAEKYAIENEYPEIDLLVTADNAAAVSFYKKESFETERYLMKKQVGLFHN